MPITFHPFRSPNWELDFVQSMLTWSWERTLWWNQLLHTLIPNQLQEMKTLKREAKAGYITQILIRSSHNSKVTPTLSSLMEILQMSKKFLTKKSENHQLSQVWPHQRMSLSQLDQPVLIQSKLVSSRPFKFKPRLLRDKLISLLKSKLFSLIQELIRPKLLFSISWRSILSSIRWKLQRSSKTRPSLMPPFLIFQPVSSFLNSREPLVCKPPLLLRLEFQLPLQHHTHSSMVSRTSLLSVPIVDSVSPKLTPY